MRIRPAVGRGGRAGKGGHRKHLLVGEVVRTVGHEHDGVGCGGDGRLVARRLVAVGGGERVLDMGEREHVGRGGVAAGNGRRAAADAEDEDRLPPLGDRRRASPRPCARSAATASARAAPFSEFADRIGDQPDRCGDPRARHAPSGPGGRAPRPARARRSTSGGPESSIARITVGPSDSTPSADERPHVADLRLVVGAGGEVAGEIDADDALPDAERVEDLGDVPPTETMREASSMVRPGRRRR